MCDTLFSQILYRYLKIIILSLLLWWTVIIQSAGIILFCIYFVAGYLHTRIPHNSCGPVIFATDMFAIL